MKHSKPIFALMAALALTATVACQKEDNEDPTGPTDTLPTDTIPTPGQFSLVGTSWMAINDEWWSSSMHVIDTSIWQFLTDTGGTIYEHYLYNDDDPYGGETYSMTYTFDNATMTGILYGYMNSDFSIAPIEFTYHPEDTTLSYTGSSLQTTIVYHLLRK